MTEADVVRLMNEYRANVVALFENESSDLAGNSSYRHAAVLIEEMVKHAKTTFYAFAGRMNPIVWNDAVMSALDKAKSNGVDIKLVIEEKCEPIINGTMPENLRCCVRKARPDILARLRDELSHCASGDGKSLRIETNSEQKTAIFSANRPDMATSVTKVIEGLYRLGEEYSHVA